MVLWVLYSYFYFLRSRQSSYEGFKVGGVPDWVFTWIMCVSLQSLWLVSPLSPSVRKHQVSALRDFQHTVLCGPWSSSRQVATPALGTA